MYGERGERGINFSNTGACPFDDCIDDLHTMYLKSILNYTDISRRTLSLSRAIKVRISRVDKRKIELSETYSAIEAAF